MGNDKAWNTIMRTIKMPLKIKIYNLFNDIKIRFLRSCKKRIAFFTKKYKNNMDETH